MTLFHPSLSLQERKRKGSLLWSLQRERASIPQIAGEEKGEGLILRNKHLSVKKKKKEKKVREVQLNFIFTLLFILYRLFFVMVVITH